MGARTSPEVLLTSKPADARFEIKMIDAKVNLKHGWAIKIDRG
jgi:hypothetical protein